jgi:ketosteroid isomerase-like protein
MSLGNVEVVRRFYAALSAVDARDVIEYVDPNVEWISDRRVGEGPIAGRERVFEFFADRASMFGELEIEVEELLERGDRVLAFLRLRGSGAASGAQFEIRIAHLWTLRDGRLVRGEGYGNRDEALEAAGLRE